MTSSNTGFVYPGQGAQQMGMGADLCDAYPLARKRFQEADSFLGFDLHKCCTQGPEKILSQDLNAQLGIYTISTIVTDLLKQKQIVPDLCTGYSSGFYAAAYAAGCFDFITGLSIVNKAGKILLKQGQSFDGGMAVIFGLSRDEILAICKPVGTVDLAIHNTPRQIIISGLKTGIETVMAEAMRKGALDTNWLPVATAYHSRFMADAGTILREQVPINNIYPPKIPLYSYTTTRQVLDGDGLRNVMAMQLSHPVLWVDLIGKLRHNCIDTLVEIGPGTMLSRSIRWIDRHIDMLDTRTTSRIQNVIQRLK